MAGYNHRRGMSKNAVGAYRRNLKSISRRTAPTQWGASGIPSLKVRGTAPNAPCATPRCHPRRRLGSPTPPSAAWS